MSPVAEPARVWRAMLHERVRAYICEASASRRLPETFDALGTEILRYQSEHVEPYRHLLCALGVDPRQARRVRDFPAVPTDAFRLMRIAAHPVDDDAAVFRTSGTTQGSRGAHAFSTLETYRAAALAWGAWGLFPDAPRPWVCVVMAACSEPGSPYFPGESSLGFMIGLFARTFGTSTSVVVSPDSSSSGTIDVEALDDVCSLSQRSGVPVVLLGTSFAFVHALDALAGKRFSLREGSRAMHTGGFKGRSREVEPSILRAGIAETFGLDPAAVVGEYGMTELSSQLYEATLRRSLEKEAPPGDHGFFHPPPWLRVTAVDSATLRPLPDGAKGLLRFEDLANVDSALVVQTQDEGRIVSGAVELFGRAPGATERGCSLAIDDWLAQGGRAVP